MAKKRRAKKRKLKKIEKVQKARKVALEKKVNETFKERKVGKPSLQSTNVPEEHRKLVVPGPTPKPLKKETAYSRAAPPVPPPQLLDLIYNFLEDFEYIKAAHDVRTENQERPGHNTQQWKRTSDRLPNLIEVFLQWQEQNPGGGKSLSGDDLAPKQTEGMTVGVYSAEPQNTSNKSAMEEMKTRKIPSIESSNASSSEVGSIDEMSIDRDANVQPLCVAKPVKKRKITDISSAELKSEGESSNSDEEHSCATSSRSESHSSSESEGSSSDISRDAPAKKRTKIDIEVSRHQKSNSRTSLSKLVSSEASSSAVTSQTSSDEESCSNGPRSDDANSGGKEPKAQNTPDYPAQKRSDTTAVNGHSDSSVTLPVKNDDEPATENYRSAMSEKVKKIKKPATPFSRIPNDLKVEQKFSSNEYRPYDYADRAHKDLSITKGKGFTKEKNKKKRGQKFRGGTIDINGGGRAIKFDD